MTKDPTKAELKAKFPEFYFEIHMALILNQSLADAEKELKQSMGVLSLVIVDVHKSDEKILAAEMIALAKEYEEALQYVTERIE